MEYLHQLQQTPPGDLIWFDLPGVADYEDAWMVGSSMVVKLVCEVKVQRS